MPNVYIIMGDANAGKSTTIKALTGFAIDWKLIQKHKWSISKTNSKKPIIIYVFLKALQEDRKIKNAVYKLIKDPKCKNILIALRIKKRSGKKHISMLSSLAKIISPVVVLTNDKNQEKDIRKALINHNLKCLLIPVKKSPPNKIAAEIRKKWGWL